MIRRLHTVDAHVAGGPLRLVVDGFPEPRGTTVAEQQSWARRHADRLRRALMLEPRGHADMCGAVFTPAVDAASDAAVLFMNNDGFGALSGHGLIAAATIAFERGLVGPREPNVLVLDTVAGSVTARATLEPARPARRRGLRATAADRAAAPAPRVTSVAVENVPAFVAHAGLPIRVDDRDLRVDVAFGGEFYAIVDAESIGVPIGPDRLPDLRRAGTEIKDAVDAAVKVVHPERATLTGLHGTVFIGPPYGGGADLRAATVFADAQVGRSPSGTALCAVMAVLDGMAMLPGDRAFVLEGLLGTTLEGMVLHHAMVGDLPAIVPELEGAAWITGEHTFIVDDDDPLRDGYRL